MNSNKSSKSSVIMDIVTLNDKGQVVIPADARAAIELHSGDKLLVMIHPSKEGITLIKPDRFEQYANQLLEQLSAAKTKHTN
ncbi:MAG TPA: AbrB/MazE/SpoVT family DNA-binding domain-containing protein [Candidatus Saccharimonadales bacterium]|nr:AbrB/MazE/SpoVT family DNA-binding domain-containing protein [Candidatus Saccharimonadales bacterium]